MTLIFHLPCIGNVLPTLTDTRHDTSPAQASCFRGTGSEQPWVLGQGKDEVSISGFCPHISLQGGKGELFKGTLAKVPQRSWLSPYPEYVRVLQHQAGWGSGGFHAGTPIWQGVCFWGVRRSKPGLTLETQAGLQLRFLGGDMNWWFLVQRKYAAGRIYDYIGRALDMSWAEFP